MLFSNALKEKKIYVLYLGIFYVIIINSKYHPFQISIFRPYKFWNIKNIQILVTRFFLYKLPILITFKWKCANYQTKQSTLLCNVLLCVHCQTKQSTLLCNAWICVHWIISLFSEPCGIFATFIFFPLFYRIRAVNEATNKTWTDVKKRSVAF